MRRFLFTLACLATTVAAETAHATTALELLERRVAKYATPYVDVYKGVCSCAEVGSPTLRRTGRLRYAIVPYGPATLQVRVWCQVTLYDVDGEPGSTSACDTFQPLAN